MTKKQKRGPRRRGVGKGKEERKGKGKGTGEGAGEEAGKEKTTGKGAGEGECKILKDKQVRKILEDPTPPLLRPPLLACSPQPNQEKQGRTVVDLFCFLIL